ncbi:hypothetical protein L3Q82_017016 [Scortum barcoo]|uniref:Uncharacterized protein n=1 Tax=Scortum barcoo TaxID=214431 RepID=A0ACB8XAM9_9TELE|nr:hypothetical protein L3Q82_017016 [Scortum barcoo]
MFFHIHGIPSDIVSDRDRHRRPAPTYLPGQKVWLPTKDLPLHVHTRKLAPRFVGPFPVSKVITPVSVQLKLPRSLQVHQTFHVSKLKPVKESPLVPPSKPPLPKMVDNALCCLSTHTHIHPLGNMTEPRNPGMSSVPQTAPVPADSTSPAVEMDPVEYTLRKRLPRKLPKRRNDVYVNMKTDFRAQLARCQKLLEGGGHREICVHGLGLAINRAINIALQLQASSQGVLQLAANTSTVELVDDLEPEDPDEAGEPMTRTRNNSAIHIKVFYPDPQ